MEKDEENKESHSQTSYKSISLYCLYIFWQKPRNDTIWYSVYMYTVKMIFDVNKKTSTIENIWGRI